MSLNIVNPIVPFLSGWGRRKRFAVAATYSDRDMIMDLNIHSGAGTDDLDDVYLDGDVRSDWGDLRITRSDGTTRIPYAILRDDEAGNITIAVRVNVVNGDNHYYVYWDGPAADVYKIGNVTDIHYDPDGASGASSEQDRVNALTYIDNFKTRMSTFSPDLVVACGDMMGAQDSDPSTQLSWAEAVLDQLTGVTGTLKRGVAMGNHDFEYVTDTNMRALIDDYEAWMESGAFYGEFHETADFVFVSLDSNYNPSGEAHLSATHLGSGYVNGPQLTWLSAYLAAASKEVIIFIHHPCGEFDTEQFTLTKKLYHTDNREQVRTILEQSQKVVAVFHGHMHFTRTDVIRGIPYIAITNLTNDDSFSELPASGISGKWGLIEFDKSSRMIRVRHEALISGTPTTIYDQQVPFAKTSLSEDISNNPEEVFKIGYGGGSGRSGWLRDACQLYVNDDTYLYKFPVNLQTPDTSTSKGSIKIEGRTDGPNYGRATWRYEHFAGKAFIFEGWVMLDTNTQALGLKLGGVDIENFPHVNIVFQDDGRIHVYHGFAPTDLDLMAYSAQTWYKIELFVDLTSTGAFNGLINGTVIGERLFYEGVTDVNFRELQIVTETGDSWIHSFSVRPWHPPRPTMNGFDDEETAP